MRPYFIDFGRHTLTGQVVVSRFKVFRRPRDPERLIVSVYVPTPGPRPSGELRRPWIVQTPTGRRHWPDAAKHEGHDVHVTATFGAYPNGIGAVAYRARVECGDEAEHVLKALT